MIRLFNKYVSPKGFVLAMLEAWLITIALLAAVRIRFWGNTAGFESYLAMPGFAFQAIAFVGILQICLYYCDLYDVAALRQRVDQLLALGQSIGSGCLLLGLLYFVFPDLVIGRGVFF